VLANDSDPDPDGNIDLASLTIVQQPAHGTATINADRTISYVPQAGFAGGDGLLYTVKDNTGLVSAPAAVIIRAGAPIAASGVAYVDLNDNGLKDEGEVGVAGATITLRKTNGVGFSHSVLTADDGSFQFVDDDLVDLPGGTYDIIQTQPILYVDGRDTPGAPSPDSTTDDHFHTVDLLPGGAATNFLFGERGVRPEFVGIVLNRRMFFASSAPGALSSFVGIDLSAGTVVVPFDAGFAGDLKAQVRFAGDAGSVRLELLDENLDTLAEATSPDNAATLRYMGEVGEPMLLMLSGTNTSATLIAGIAGEAALSARRWHNQANPADVDDDGQVAPIDAHAIINLLNGQGAGPVAQKQASGSLLLDVDNDGYIAPIDALLVINQLNRAAAMLALSDTGEAAAATDDALLGLSAESLQDAALDGPLFRRRVRR
jgi:hypothetical protein